MHFLAVDGKGEVGNLGRGVGKRRLEIGHVAQQVLVAGGVAHDQLIVAAPRHNREAEGLPVGGLYLAHVEVEGDGLVHHLAQGVALVRLEKVQRQEVRGAGGEGQDGDARVAQLVGNAGNGAVAAAGNHEVEVGRIGKQTRKLGVAAQKAHGNRIAFLGVASHEVVDGPVAQAGA